MQEGASKTLKAKPLSPTEVESAWFWILDGISMMRHDPTHYSTPAFLLSYRVLTNLVDATVANNIQH